MSKEACAAPHAWFELIESHARERGAQTAISVRRPDGSFVETSFFELAQRIKAFARLFEARTAPGQVVPMCLSRGMDAAAAMLGALVVGRAFCCVSAKLRIPQIAHIVGATRSPCALIDETGLLALRGDLASHPQLFEPEWVVLSERGVGRLAKRVSRDLAERARVGEFVPDLGESAAFCSRAEPPASTWQPLAEPVIGSAADFRSHAQGRASTLGACLFTSGSTGMPKGVLISSADLHARARAEAAWFGLSAADVLLNVLPFSFDVGLNQLLSALVAGAELCVLDSWLPQDILQTTSVRKVTGISGVPSIWADLMREGAGFDRAGSHRGLRYITVSGGDLTRAQHERLPALVQGAEIFKTYGQTEAFRATSLRPEEYGRRPGSVGRPFLGVHLYIVREDGTRADPGESGEVVHSGLGVMLGYLDGSDPQNKLRDNPWLGSEDSSPRVIYTGDVGYLDSEGYLFLAGRRDDLVKIQGNRVYPGEVRNQIARLPGVASVEVVVVRTEARSELAAFVVPAPDRELDPKTLRTLLARELPSYMVPELFALSESLPRTVSGKPDRVQLLLQATQLLGAQLQTEPEG